MKNIKFPYAPAIVWGIFIFVLSVMPGKDFPKIPDWGDLLSLDKMVHITFYSLLTWLILRGKSRNTEGVSLLFALIVAISCSGYGWFLEWVQGNYCEDRTADVMDGIANTMGAALGLSVFLFFQKRKMSNKNA